jgi:hypothetical protein
MLNLNIEELMKEINIGFKNSEEEFYKEFNLDIKEDKHVFKDEDFIKL